MTGYTSPDEFDCGIPSLHWFAIYVAGNEINCEQILRDGGVATFLPIVHTIRKRSQYSKAKVLDGRPLLRGYVFVGFDQYPGAIEWDSVFRFAFVRYVVGVGGLPTMFDARVMHKALKLAQRPVPVLRSRKAGRKAYRGQAAEIVSGPYQGKSVRVAGIQGRAALEIFEMLQPIALLKAA